MGEDWYSELEAAISIPAENAAAFCKAHQVASDEEFDKALEKLGCRYTHRPDSEDEELEDEEEEEEKETEKPEEKEEKRPKAPLTRAHKRAKVEKEEEDYHQRVRALGRVELHIEAAYGGSVSFNGQFILKLIDAFKLAPNDLKFFATASCHSDDGGVGY